tara:strand:- start:685 stop:924 length:240 start_codon:yes stop_codon:yes gene_type:complete|eukprot:scaffold1135_cov53-Phaeocystis_antarctica.AAC.5
MPASEVDPWIMREPHQHLVCHVLAVAVLVLNEKARSAVVIDDLALENAETCAAQRIERSEALSWAVLKAACGRAYRRTS